MLGVIAIGISALSLGFAVWQYRRTRVPRVRLTCIIGVMRMRFEDGGKLEQPIVDLKALNIGHVPVTLERLSARWNGRELALSDGWFHVNETNEFPHRLDPAASWMGTLDYFGLEEKTMRVFGPRTPQRFTFRLWDATDRAYECTFELDDAQIPPLEVYPDVNAARAVAAAFRRHKEQQPAPLARFVPIEEPAATSPPSESPGNRPPSPSHRR